MAEDWKELLKRCVADDIRRGDVLLPHTYVLDSLILALHSKGILSDEDRDALFQAMDDACDAHAEARKDVQNRLRDFLGESREE